MSWECHKWTIRGVPFRARKEDFAVGRMRLVWLIVWLVGEGSSCPFPMETRKEALVDGDEWGKGKEVFLSQAWGSGGA